MCLFPKLIKNPKYKPNKKNKGNVPEPTDRRVLFVPVGCGNCIECRKQKANEWKTRLNIELQYNKENAYYVTMTFTNENLIKLCKELKIEECNAIASKAIRRFCERWRKEYKKSIRHFLITELGHEGTERIHLHGILWTKKDKETIQKIWKYGHIEFGEYVNLKTINYIMKYITKIDIDHKGYKSEVLCSKGIGKIYLQTRDAENCKYNGKNTKEFMRLQNGTKVNLPIYYRNKIYTEEERELLWIQKLDKEERYILGKKYNVSTEYGQRLFEQAQKEAQEKNNRCGYGNDSEEWNKKKYNITNRKLNKLTKEKKFLQDRKKHIKKN